jgi:hypothetical protein
VRIVTRPFRLTYLELMKAATLEYLRNFWWYIGLYPIFGLALIFFGPNELMRNIGVLALLWPLTLPLRARVPLSRAMRVREDVRIGVEGDELLLISGDRESRRPLGSVRRVVDASGFLYLYTGPMHYLIVPRNAFESPEEAAAFKESIGMGSTTEGTEDTDV